MNLWRRLRTELSGAWRSLRYDLGRRPAVPDSGPRIEGPDVTCTGMSTFGLPMDGVPKGGVPTEGVPIGTGEGWRATRPLAAVSVFVLLAVVGAAASYLAVVNGLGSLLREKPATPRPYPMAAAPPETSGAPNAGLGRAGGLRRAPRVSTPATSRGTEPPAPLDKAVPQPPPRPEAGGTPPVPTPTAPPPARSTEPSPEPSAGPPSSDPPSATPPSSEPSDGPGPSGDATTGPTAGTGDESLVRYRHRY